MVTIYSHNNTYEEILEESEMARVVKRKTESKLQ